MLTMEAGASLTEQRRQLDDACYSCHVTGAGHADGPATARAAEGAKLVNVGCESCHGPGKAHVAAPSEVKLRRDPGVDVCIACHDGKQDEGRFDYPTYRPKVVHP